MISLFANLTCTNPNMRRPDLVCLWCCLWCLVQHAAAFSSLCAIYQEIRANNKLMSHRSAGCIQPFIRGRHTSCGLFRRSQGNEEKQSGTGASQEPASADEKSKRLGQAALVGAPLSSELAELRSLIAKPSRSKKVLVVAVFLARIRGIAISIMSLLVMASSKPRIAGAQDLRTQGNQVTVTSPAPHSARLLSAAEDGSVALSGSTLTLASVMLSMETAESKRSLAILVSAAYGVVWSFFYFTHDHGETSE